MGERVTRRHIIVALLLITSMCLPVVILQKNWAGLAVVTAALGVSLRELVVAIRRTRG